MFAGGSGSTGSQSGEVTIQVKGRKRAPSVSFQGPSEQSSVPTDEPEKLPAVSGVVVVVHDSTRDDGPVTLPLASSPEENPDVSSWTDALSTASDAAAVIGLVLIVFAFFGGFAWMQALLFSARRHLMIVRRARRGVAVSSELSAYGRFKVTFRYMRRRASGEALTVADELTWLSSVAEGRDHRKPAKADRPLLPLTFSDAFRVPGAPDDRELRLDTKRLEEVIRAYRRYSIRVGSRLFLRAIARPIAQSEQELSAATATHLSGITALRPVGGPAAFQSHDVADGLTRLGYELDGSTAVELRSSESGIARRIAIASWHRGGLGHSLAYPILVTDYEQIRFVTHVSADLSQDGVPLAAAVPAGPVGSDHAPEAEPDEPDSTSVTANEPEFEYDGILTRLHRDPASVWDSQRRRGFREERDPFSGRLALHLSLAQVPYSAVKKYNYEGVHLPLDDDSVGASSLLTLNLLAIDTEGRAVLVERSRKVPVHPHGAAGTVSGNAELSERIGIASDLDSNGFPDLLAAAGREAREEVGLVLGAGHDSLGALGLHTISSEYERGTHVLTFVSTLKESANVWIPDVPASDPLEGAWEVGDHLVVVDLRRAWASPASRQALFVWLKSDLRLTGHAVGGLVMAGLAARGKEKDEDTGRYLTSADLFEFISAEISETAPLPDTVLVRRWRELACSPSCPWWSDGIPDRKNTGQ
jgi:hypothetical protein